MAPLLKDLWRVGIVREPIDTILARGGPAGPEIVWLQEPAALRFMADPFGLWRDGVLQLFVETYDYRDRLGAIEVLTLDADLRLLQRRPVLNEPWHLSYPFLIEDGGETYMLPEAHRSGRLTLYRATDWPTGWEPAATITLDHVPIDATPLFHNGLWWLFYTPATTNRAKIEALHVAWAKRLTGPWTPHPLNPVRLDASSSRPGGTPVAMADGAVVLPVQDCTATYGGGLRTLRISVLTPDRFEAQAGPAMAMGPAFGRYTEGFHTLSAAGPVTLIDAKRREVSARSLGLDAARQIRSLGRRLGVR